MSIAHEARYRRIAGLVVGCVLLAAGAVVAPAIAQPVADTVYSHSDTEPVEDRGGVAFHINFASDSAVLPAEASGMLDMISQLMKESPEVKLRIEVHANEAGSIADNLLLSQRRAVSVGDYLIGQGIEANRFSLVGKGMAEPLTGDPHDRVNQRVQFMRVS